MASKNYTQRHYPPGSGGCTRDVDITITGDKLSASVKRTNGSMKQMDPKIEAAIKKAMDDGEDMAIYEFNGSKYYIDLKGNGLGDADGDDSKSDDEFEDLDITHPEPGFPFVGDGAGQKIDIPFNDQQSVLTLKQAVADVQSCDPSEIEIIAEINGEFRKVEYQTLADNGIKSMKDVMIFKKDDRVKAVKSFIRAKKWEDKPFVEKAKDWLKDTGNEGQAGIDNLIKKNGLDAGWNDILAKLEYSNVLKIIKDESMMSNIDRARVDEDFRKKYGITKDQTAKLTFVQLQKMQEKTEALREKFYTDISKAALQGVKCEVDPDCKKIFDQFKPGDNMTFYGIISLIDGKDLKAMGIPCKDFNEIKMGKIYMYPSLNHGNKIQWKGGQGPASVNGHEILCELAGYPTEYCGGFSIMPPKLKFRSGQCNSSKNYHKKIKGFDNGKALSAVLQECLEKAFKGTRVGKFYSEIEWGGNY